MLMRIMKRSFYPIVLLVILLWMSPAFNGMSKAAIISNGQVIVSPLRDAPAPLLVLRMSALHSGESGKEIRDDNAASISPITVDGKSAVRWELCFGHTIWKIG